MRWTTPAIVSVLYLALAGSVIAFWLNYWLLKRIGATKLLAMSLVEPLIAVVLGAIVLREALPAGTLLGGALHPREHLDGARAAAATAAFLGVVGSRVVGSREVQFANS